MRPMTCSCQGRGSRGSPVLPAKESFVMRAYVRRKSRTLRPSPRAMAAAGTGVSQRGRMRLERVLARAAMALPEGGEATLGDAALARSQRGPRRGCQAELARERADL